mgnify:FL=1
MIAIVDYGVGNLFSVEKALRATGADAVVTADGEVLQKAERIVLPGVGAFGDCMKNLQASGLLPVLKDRVAKGCPLLGICVGMQILFGGSEESPGVFGLGWISGKVRRIAAPGRKIPHMGWNSLHVAKQHAAHDLFAGLNEAPYVYFVHSYAAVPENPAVVTATVEYGSHLVAAIAQGNIMATQFHPEKSGDVGLAILKNFVSG